MVEKRRKLRNLMIIGGMIICILIITSTTSKGVLQANPNTNYKTEKTLVYTSTSGGNEGWLTAIRKMEATGGAMGLTGAITNSTLAGPVNGIDVHCMKNTEYGAMAILSASSYGYNGKVTTGTTTTGNKTGIDIDTNQEELTAATNRKDILYGSTSAKGCYINLDEPSGYSNRTLTMEETKKGDALADCRGWYGGTARILYDTMCVYLRGKNSIFSYNGGNNTDYRCMDKKSYARAVVVCGEGL